MTYFVLRNLGNGGFVEVSKFDFGCGCGIGEFVRDQRFGIKSRFRDDQLVIAFRADFRQPGKLLLEASDTILKLCGGSPDK